MDYYVVSIDKTLLISNEFASYSVILYSSFPHPLLLALFYNKLSFIELIV